MSQALTSPAGLPVRQAHPSAESSHPVTPTSTRPHVLLPALLSAGLCWLSYFPVNYGWLGWVALVPLLTLVYSPARPRRIYFFAWLGGLAFFGPALQWLRVADPRMVWSWVGLTLYCAAYWPLGLWMVRRLRQRTGWPLLVLVPVVWTPLEYLRSTFGTGFSWYLLSHTQHDFLPFIQVSDITGAYGVTFLVAAVNALLCDVLLARPWARRLLGLPEAPVSRPIARLGHAVVLFALLMACLAYGSWRLAQARPAPGPRLALVQGNVPQQIRNYSFDPNDTSGRDRVIRQMNDHYVSLADMASQFHPDLIVWPETSYPAEWELIAPEVPRELRPVDWYRSDRYTRDRVRDLGRRWRTPTLLGLNTRILTAEDTGRGKRYNTAMFIDEAGQLGALYHKKHRVPFGEYVPFVDWLPSMKKLSPYDYDYAIWPGPEFTRFPVTLPGRDRPVTFGALICYEDADPDIARPYGGADGQPPADFLVNLSNDGWFDGTEEHEQHLAICRFRAVEMRRSVARSVNMGISAVIDSNGRVLAPQELPRPDQLGVLGFNALNGSLAGLPWWALATADWPGAPVWCLPESPVELRPSQWSAYKKVPGILVGAIPLDERTSLYARLGDWLPWGCWLLVGGVFITGWLRRKSDP
jgi:apolipoprotein N-acyltransferase